MTQKLNTKVSLRRAAMTLLLAVFTATAWAWSQHQYIERSWVGSEIVSTTKYTYDFTELNGNHSNDELNLVAGQDYVVTADATYKRLIAPSGTAAHLILCDGTTLNAQITINKGCSLNIYCQSGGTGTINAKAIESYSYAAIGTVGYSNDDSEFPCMGTLTIHGGIINANSSDVGFAAGIGGGNKGTGGTVTIYGGTITAKGGSGAAGIGGGYQCNGGTVTIYGGSDGSMTTVTATGGNGGSGIGSGEGLDGKGGTVTIHGGTVTAKGGNYAAGIGGGQKANGADVTIHGGTVRAYGGTDAAGIGSGEEAATSTNINGGKLTVYGGYVFADGTDKGCGIGAGEDADGADVKIYGGIVEAWCGSGSRTAAIGSEEGDDHRGTLDIGDNMMVHAGSNPSNVSKFPYDTRKPACWYRDFARIEPCDHKGKTYTVSGYRATDTHTLQCSYCLDRTTETHNFAEAGSPCSVCGVQSAISTLSIYLPEKVNGEFVNGHYGDEPSNSVNLITNSSYTFPAPPTEHLPNGVTFAGWAVGTPTSLGITSYWVGTNETIIKPGESYTVAENTSVTARYKAIELSLADNADNWLILYDNNGKLAKSVTLAGRTLYRDGNWNTLCLPFDVTIAGSPLAGADVRTLSSSSFDSTNGELTLNFTAQNAITTIEAGKPYIIKWASDSNLTEADLVFNDKTISYTMQDVVCDLGNDKSVTFKGTYSYTNFIVETPSILLLGDDNSLYYPQPDETTNPTTYPHIGAQRAYFQLKGITAGEPNTSGSAKMRIVLNFGDEEDTGTATGITTTNLQLDEVNSDNAWYDLRGRRISVPFASSASSVLPKGVYIYKGKKVIIK